MKRSDMVKILSNHLHENTSMADRLEANFQADQIIALVESFGMKPPVEDVCPVIFKTTHVWEKEEEC